MEVFFDRVKVPLPSLQTVDLTTNEPTLPFRDYVTINSTTEFMRLYPFPISTILNSPTTFVSATHFEIMVLRGMVSPRIFLMRHSCSNLKTSFTSFLSTTRISSSSEITPVASASLAWFSPASWSTKPDSSFSVVYRRLHLVSRPV